MAAIGPQKHAAANGYIHVQKWAHENGCPWNADTCAEAARCDRLAVLKWARAHDCPWDQRVCMLK